MKNTKRKHLKLCLLLLFMVLGCFAITNVRTTTVKEQVLPAHIRKAKMDLNLNEARWY